MLVANSMGMTSMSNTKRLRLNRVQGQAETSNPESKEASYDSHTNRINHVTM